MGLAEYLVIKILLLLLYRMMIQKKDKKELEELSLIKMPLIKLKEIF